MTSPENHTKGFAISTTSIRMHHKACEADSVGSELATTLLQVRALHPQQTSSSLSQNLPLIIPQAATQLALSYLIFSGWACNNYID